MPRRQAGGTWAIFLLSRLSMSAALWGCERVSTIALLWLLAMEAGKQVLLLIDVPHHPLLQTDTEQARARSHFTLVLV